MLSSPRRAILALGALTWVACTASAAATAGPDDKQIAQWIAELNHDDFAVREKASRQLWLAGEAAEAALEKTLESGRPEAVRRARDILDKFHWGIYGDTPAEVVALIRAYKAREDVHDEAVEKLLDADVAGLRAVLLIARNDTNAERVEALRNRLLHRMLGHLQKVFDRIEDKTRWDRFITLAHEGMVLEDRHFAAYWLLRGRLDDRIRDFRARLARNVHDKRAALTLVYLLRARGDLAEARTLAEREEFDDLFAGLLLKMGDWKTLAARPELLDVEPIEQASYRASFARLSGDQKQWEAATADLNKLGHGQDAHKAGLAFLANGRPSEGIKLLSSRGYNRRFAFLVLCDRLQYREAMALVEQTPANADDRAELEIQLANTWDDLGEPDKGKALLQRLGERLKEGRNHYWSQQLLRMERRLGLNDLALEHCAGLMALPQPKRDWSPQDVDYLGEVFGRQGDYRFWYPLLRGKFPKDSIRQSVQRLRDLFAGKVVKATVKE